MQRQRKLQDRWREMEEAEKHKRQSESVTEYRIR